MRNDKHTAAGSCTYPMVLLGLCGAALSSVRLLLCAHRFSFRISGRGVAGRRQDKHSTSRCSSSPGKQQEGRSGAAVAHAHAHAFRSAPNRGSCPIQSRRQPVSQAPTGGLLPAVAANRAAGIFPAGHAGSRGVAPRPLLCSWALAISAPRQLLSLRQLYALTLAFASALCSATTRHVASALSVFLPLCAPFLR